jgi:hypothetical protein
MNLSAQEVTATFFSLPEQEQQTVFDFMEFLKTKSAKQQSRCLFSMTEENKTQQTEGEKLLAVLKKTGFLGSLPDVPDLSVNYKEHLDWSDKI